MSRRLTKDHENVIPVEAGIQNAGRGLDSHLRGNDGQLEGFSDDKEDHFSGNIVFISFLFI
jgi:hypothetical protein